MLPSAVMLWILACTKDVDTGQDTSQRDSGYLYILSNHWSGEAIIEENVSYDGTETYHHNKGLYEAGSFACVLTWDMDGVPSHISQDTCVDCVFQFEILATPQSGNHIVNDGTCDDYFSEPMTFHYAYTPDYQGHGPSMMYYSADYFQWFAWIRDGDVVYETPQSVSYTQGVFSYSGGFMDYYYYSDILIGGGN